MAELQRAFISPDMISVGETLISAVVTAGRWPEDGLVITIRPIEAPEALASLIVVIDERDMAEVQKLLGEERERPASEDLNWEEIRIGHVLLQTDQLEEARKALRIIAGMEETKQEPEDSWRETLFRTIELAANTLENIERMEADDGTPSDS